MLAPSAERDGSVARILVDADVLLDHLRGQRRFIPADDVVHVSAITRAELAAMTGTIDSPVTRLLDAMTEIPVDAAVAQRGGRIRRLTGAPLANALIAATALEHDLTLVTRNLWEYKGIAGLDAMAPEAR
jgi:predicted nucleic acid-binding protein